MEDWNERHGKPGRSLQEICSDQRVRDFVFKEKEGEVLTPTESISIISDFWVVNRQ